MITKFIQLILIVSAMAYIVLSGSAEGFLSPRALIALPLFFSIIWIFILLFKELYLIAIKKNPINRKAVYSNVGIIGLAFLLIYIGNFRDQQLILETQARGNIIIEEAIKFKTAKNQFPKNLEELSQTGFKIPEPALANSKFQYAIENENEISLIFDSVAFLICQRTSSKPEWTCSD